MTHTLAAKGAVGMAVTVVGLVWFGIWLDYLGTRNSMSDVVQPANVTAAMGAYSDTPAERDQFHKIVYYMVGVGPAVGHGILVLAGLLFFQPEWRHRVEKLGEAIVWANNFLVGGIALVIVALTYLDGAKERFVPLAWATIAGLFAASVAAYGQTIHPKHRSPVAITLQNMSLGFIALIFYTLNPETPQTALGHKTIALFYVVGNSLSACDERAAHIRVVRNLNFFFAHLGLSIIGGSNLLNDPVIDAAWSRPWDTSNDAFGPIFMLFWAVSLFSALVGIVTWVLLAVYRLCPGKLAKHGSGIKAATETPRKVLEEQAMEWGWMAGGASAVALLAWLGIGWMFLASYATMSPVITRLQMLEYAALPPYDDSDGALTKFWTLMHWLTGISLSIPWGFGIFSLCRDEKTRNKYDMFVHSLEAIAGIAIAGIATIAVALSYLSDAQRRLIPLEWATIGGLFAAASIASNLRARDESHKMPVGVTVQQMLYGFIGLLFWSMQPEMPYLSLSYKIVAVLFVLSTSLPEYGNATFFTRNVLHLVRFTAGAILCFIGGVSWPTRNPLVTMAWKTPWQTSYDSARPVFILMWAASLVVAIVLVSYWIYKIAAHFLPRVSGAVSEKFRAKHASSRPQEQIQLLASRY